MISRPFSPVFGCLDVAQALLPAASALMPTLACEQASRRPTGVETSLDTAGTGPEGTPCATSLPTLAGMVGRTPPSAAGPLAGLPRAAWFCFRERKAGPGGPGPEGTPTRGAAPPTCATSNPRRLRNAD